jgi:hypothetical protein
LFGAPGAPIGAFRVHSFLSGDHPLQGHKSADVVNKVLQANFDFRPRDADRPDNPATWRGLLSTEHMLDAGPNSASDGSRPPH